MSRPLLAPHTRILLAVATTFLALLASAGLRATPGVLMMPLQHSFGWGRSRVPPTMKVANQAFGERDGPIVFGWILTGHQLGAAIAAFGAGLIRQQTGTYLPAFVAAGAMGLVAAGVLLLPLNDRRQVSLGTA